MALGLLGSYVSSSSEDEDEAPKILVEPKPKPALLLSNPFGSGSTVARAKPSYALEIHDLTTGQGKKVENSVFSNPFRAKEDKEKALLEHHVRMTSKQEDQRKSSIEGKKICWNFRKGRCRFGHKCTYAHDSDVLASIQRQTESSELPESELTARLPTETASTSKKYDDSAVISSSGMHQSVKKKRPGLSDQITPSKKAMKFFDKVYESK